jgi:acyl transferase domain-containing protein
VKDPVEAARGQRRAFTPIAVVGVSALFPGSLDKTGFWRDILAGKDLLKEIPETHWLIDDYYDADPTKPDKTYAKRGAFLDDVPFDPMEWGIPPSIVPQTDTTQLLALIVAKQVLDDATRGQFASMDRSRTSCILGVTSGQELMGSMVARLQRPVWVKALRESGMPESEVQAVCDRISATTRSGRRARVPGPARQRRRGRIANRLDLGGTNCVTDAACASTFSALSMAVNELYARPVGPRDLRRRATR